MDLADGEYDYYNFTTEEQCHFERVRGVQVVRVYVHAVICFLGFVGNILVILTYAFYKRAKSITDVYLLNVAVADLVFVLTLPLIIYNEEHDWAMGNVACKSLRGMYSINVYSGMLLLACISIDRYIAIVQARRSFRLRSRILAYNQITCVAIWLLALGLSIPTFLYNERYDTTMESVMMDDTVEDERDFSKFVCYYNFNEVESAKMVKVLIPSLQIAVGFCLPLLIMSFSYFSIIVTLLQVNNFQRHRAVRVVMAVVVVFIVCHLPYNVVLLGRTVFLFEQMPCQEKQAVEMALVMSESLAYLHCCLNPVLYAFIGAKFRSHFRKIIEDLWCLGKRYIYTRRTSRVTSEAYLSTRRSIEGSVNENVSSFTM